MRSIEFLREFDERGEPMSDAEYAMQQAQRQKYSGRLNRFGQKIAGAFRGNNTAAAAQPAAAQPAQAGTLTTSDGKAVTDSSGRPVGAGLTQAQLDANVAAIRQAEQAALGAGAQASTASAEQSSAVAAPARAPAAPARAPAAPARAPAAPAAPAAAVERSPEQDMGAGKAPAPQEDDIETRMFGAGKAPIAKPAAPSTSMDDSDDAYAREFVPPTAAAPAAPTAPAAPAAASAGAQTAPAAAANYDSMTFNQAFAAARNAGAKDFMWRNKKYAVKMASPQTGQTTKFPAGTVKNAAGGLTTTNAGGAATSVTRNSRPVVPGSLRAIQQANQAAATAAGTQKAPVASTQKAPVEPAAPAAPPVAQTAANLQGISGDQIANHKNYNQYYNQALAGQNTARAQQTAQQVATLKVKADMAKGINERAPMRANTFAESVDMMRRLSNMLKG